GRRGRRLALFPSALLGSGALGALLARPASGQPAERAARAMVEQATHGAEDRALEQQRRYELLPGNLAVLWVGGLFVVEDSPQAFEDLLADQAGEDPADHAEGHKEDLGHRDIGSLAILRV